MFSNLVGPSFLAFVVDDLAAASAFWTDVVGLEPALQSPPGAQVYQTSPIPIAVRVAREGEVLESGQRLTAWFSLNGDVDEFRALLLQRGAHAGEPQNGPFGRMFVLSAPGGFAVTIHAAAP